MATNDFSLLAMLLEHARARSRTSWNDRFAHWQRPASDTEEAIIQRAAAMVRQALTGNAWLSAHGVTVEPQGSYHNNTNVRQDSDIDLRVVHPDIYTLYHQDVVRECADEVLGYRPTQNTVGGLIGEMREQLARTLRQAFGANSVTLGNKALCVRGIPGSRVDVDVVPTLRLHHVDWDMVNRRYTTSEGVLLVNHETGEWTQNFPDQHYVNGVDKRARTAHRFKKYVRIFKRMRNDLAASGAPDARIPSFLVECLVYSVSDAAFLHDEDAYDRALRILREMQGNLAAPAWVQTVAEINGVKYLFRDSQPWTVDQARRFVSLALARMEG